MGYFGFVGPLGNPEVFSEMLGKPIGYQTVRLSDHAVIFQPPEQTKDVIRRTLDDIWQGKYYGAFAIAKRPGRKGTITVYDVDKEDELNLERKLRELHLNNLDLFKFGALSFPFHRRIITIKTEFLADERFVTHPPIHYKQDPRYNEFVLEMLGRFRSAHSPKAEGQMYNEGLGFLGHPERM